jgi:hypothetical protein
MFWLLKMYVREQGGETMRRKEEGKEEGEEGGAREEMSVV